MKKLSVVLVVVLSMCLVVSLAFAADHIKKGTVKSVDAKAGSIVVTVDGKDMTFKADKAVDVAKFKAGDKVEVRGRQGRREDDQGRCRSGRCCAREEGPGRLLIP